MTNPDSIRRREREAKAREQRLNRDENFHETLAAPVPNRTYRSEIDMTESHATTAEQIVRFISTLLCTLLALRFLTSLINSDRSNGIVNVFYSLTDWMVRPFQALFNSTPAGSGSYFDWPALASLAVIAIVASLVIRALRTPRV